MPTWFFIALGAPFLWAVVNQADHYLVSRLYKNEPAVGSLVLYSSLFGIVAAGLILIFFPGVLQTSGTDRIILLIVGILQALWIILYLHALEADEVSSVVPWFQTIPIFGYILGYFFLGETLSSKELLGSIIIVLGSILLSINFQTQAKSRLKTKVVFFMVSASIIIALSNLLFKYVTVEDTFWISSFWEYAGLGVAGVFIFIFVGAYRRPFITMLRTSGKKILALNIGSETITIVGNLLSSFALLLAPLALVLTVSAYQPLIVLILSLLLTKFFPKINTENTSMRNLAPKIVAIVLMLIGSTLLFI